jgi:hypothetical protein
MNAFQAQWLAAISHQTGADAWTFAICLVAYVTALILIFRRCDP